MSLLKKIWQHVSHLIVPVIEQTAVVTNRAKRPALEDDGSCDEEEEEVTGIQMFDTALTLARDLLLFLVRKKL